MFFLPVVGAGFVGGVANAETAAWVAAVVANGGTVSNARKLLVDALITGLKTDDVWTKLDRLWLFAAENAASALTDLRAASLATAVSAPSFTADLGYAGDGAASYIDTNYNPTTNGINFVLDSAHYALWSTTDHSAAVSRTELSADDTKLRLDIHQGIGTLARLNTTGNSTPTLTYTPPGHLLGNRDAAGSEQFYQNGAVVAMPAFNSTTLANANFFVDAGNSGGTPNNFSASQIVMVSMGGSLTGTVAANFYSRLRTFFTAMANYTGPGDVVPGATAWWGLRGYSWASVGRNAVRLREDGGNTEQDFAIIAGGGLDLAAISTFKGANNLFVVKVYDQIGTNHFVQATAANQPKFTLNAIGSLPAMQDNGAASAIMQTTNNINAITPFTFSTVYKVTTTGDAMIAIGASAFPQIRVDSGLANKITINGINAGITQTAADGDWHAVQGVFNGAVASDLNLNGVSQVGDANGDAGAQKLDVFGYSGGGGRLTGYISELGYWLGSAFTGAQSTSMSANQHTYWGF